MTGPYACIYPLAKAENARVHAIRRWRADGSRMWTFCEKVLSLSGPGAVSPETVFGYDFPDCEDCKMMIEVAGRPVTPNVPAPFI